MIGPRGERVNQSRANQMPSPDNQAMREFAGFEIAAYGSRDPHYVERALLSWRKRPIERCRDGRHTYKQYLGSTETSFLIPKALDLFLSF